MLGSIFKYAAVLAVGAVGFITAAHYMDEDVMSSIKTEIELHKTSLGDLKEEDFKEKMNQYVVIKRDEWVSRLTFASSVTELDTILGVWH